MKLSVKQAADRIRVPKHTIKTLVKRGLLVDHKPRVEGASKHFSLIDSKQLDEVAREYNLRGARRLHFNGSGPIKVTSSAKPVVSAAATSPLGVISRIEERLTKIEEGIAQLLAVWS
jgi:hypothetical protein